MIIQARAVCIFPIFFRTVTGQVYGREMSMR